VNVRLLEMYNKAGVSFFHKLPQHFPERIGQNWAGDYQANPPQGQFNHLVTVYLPIIFIPPTTQRNIFGRFEKKKESEMTWNEMVVT